MIYVVVVQSPDSGNVTRFCESLLNVHILYLNIHFSRSHFGLGYIFVCCFSVFNIIRGYAEFSDTVLYFTRVKKYLKPRIMWSNGSNGWFFMSVSFVELISVFQTFIVIDRTAKNIFKAVWVPIQILYLYPVTQISIIFAVASYLYTQLNNHTPPYGLQLMIYNLGHYVKLPSCHSCN